MKGNNATYSLTYEKRYWDDNFILGLIANDDVHCNSLMTYGDAMANYLQINLNDLISILAKIEIEYKYSIFYIKDFKNIKQLEVAKDHIDSLMLMKKLSKKS